MGNDAYWLIKYFDDKTLEYLHKRFDKESGLNFINRYNTLINKADGYIKENIVPESDEGKLFAKDFWELINEFIGNDMSKLSDLMKSVDINSDNAEWKHTQTVIKSFIEPSLGFYFDEMEKKNG